MLERPCLQVCSGAINWLSESARQSLPVLAGGGKSGLQRARRQIASGRREPMESATENIPPARVRVKRCGKSAPRC